MSEYIEIVTEETDDGTAVLFFTNLRLTIGEAEDYSSPAEMEEGSPLAQTLAMIPGLTRLRIAGQELVVWREPDVPWYALIEDITAVLKDFFL
jgi:hypothetical protein